MKNTHPVQISGLSLVAGIALFVPQADAAVMVYTTTGGLISGTIGGTPFVNAAWSITATADTANIQSGFLSVGGSSLPYNSVAVDPVLTIDDGVSAPWEATLLDIAPFSWHVVTIDYLTLAPIDLDGFLLFDGTISGYGAAITPPIGFTSLTTVESFAGDSTFPSSTTFQTSLGDLIINNDSNDTGTFTVSPVPETSTVIPTMTLIAGGLLLRRRTGRVVRDR